MTEKEFSKVITALCNGDSPVTVTGAFYEVVCYLEGYGKGMAVVKNSHSVFTPFLQWFSKKLGKNSREVIRWFHFRELYSSDEEALNNLSSLYTQYIEFNSK